MQRARKLLKACNTLSNTPRSIISNVLGIITIILVGGCIVGNIYGFYKPANEWIYSTTNLSSASMVVMLLTIRSIYTVFFEDKRKGTKNNLRALTVHLPINKQEFILAQFLGDMYVYLPAFVLVSCLITFNVLGRKNVQYTFLLGGIVACFSITYILLSLEKGLCLCYYINPRIREIIYTLFTFIWMGIGYSIEIENSSFLLQIVYQDKSMFWVEGISLLGRLGGFLCLGLAFIGGYILSVKLPLYIERRK